METPTRNIVTAVGAFALLSTAYSFSSALWTYLRPSSLPRYLKTKDGSAPWAFITGASDGIGKAFSEDLASRGFNIILHGRNPDKLAGVKAQLQSKYPHREVRLVVADAKDLSEQNLQQMVQQVADITIKILINNVGSTMERGHEFDTIENYTAREIEENIAINGTFPILLTGALMPKLAASEPSLIINIGTIADIGMPLFPAYGPAKASLMASTAELIMEQYYMKRDIEVIMMRVGQVANTGTIVAPPSFLAPDAPTWVKSALARVGCGKIHLFPYAPHAIQAAILQGLPEFMARKAKVQGVLEQIALDVTGAQAAKAAKGAEKKEM